MEPISPEELVRLVGEEEAQATCGQDQGLLTKNLRSNQPADLENLDLSRGCLAACGLENRPPRTSNSIRARRHTMMPGLYS